MPLWRVRDVMAAEVITASDEASFAEVAALLAEHRISAVPIVDRFDAVVGVVSWSDLQDKIDVDEPGDNAPVGWWRRGTPLLLRWPAGNAGQGMSAPPLTIGLDASLPAAGRLMYRRKVGRLLVVDDSGRLRGIVTRSDLLKVHARLNAVIRDEVMPQRGTLMMEPVAAVYPRRNPDLVHRGSPGVGARTHGMPSVQRIRTAEEGGMRCRAWPSMDWAESAGRP